MLRLRRVVMLLSLGLLACASSASAVPATFVAVNNPTSFATVNVGSTSGEVRVDFAAVPGSGTTTFYSTDITSVSGTNASDFAVVSGGNACYGAYVTSYTGATCSVFMRFSPSGTGTRTAVLSLTSDNGQTVTANLSGTGATPPPPVSLTTGPIAFGSHDVSSSTNMTVTATNNSGLYLNFPRGSAVLSGADASSFQVSSVHGCVGTTAPSGTCNISVGFVPVSSGDKTATLTLTAGTGQSASVALTGRALAGVLDPLPTSVDAGAVPLGSTSSAPVLTLRNVASGLFAGGLTYIDSYLSGGDAAQFHPTVTGCTPYAVLAPAATCTIAISFTPTSAGPKSTTLYVVTSATGASVTVTGTGSTPSASTSTPTASAPSVVPARVDDPGVTSEAPSSVPDAPKPRVDLAELPGASPSTKATAKDGVIVPGATATCTLGAGPCDDGYFSLETTSHGRRVTIGKAPLRLRDGESDETLSLALSPYGRALLRRAGSLVVTATIVVRNGTTGVQAVETRTFVLKA